MAQPLIKFFRVDKLTDLQATQKVQGGLYFETSTGVLYVYNGTDFEAYSGLKSASFADQKLILTPSVGDAITIDLSGYVDSTEFNTELANYVKKEQTIAGIDLQDNITAEELKTALGLTATNLAGQANVLEGVKVNGEALAIATDKTVDVLVAEGSANGTIAVNGKDVAVHGLGSAAYHAEGDFVSSTGYVAYSQAEKEKLADIEAGAEVNIIEEVQVNGAALAVSTDGKRAVNVEVPVLGVSDADEILHLDENKKLNATVALSYGSKSAGGDGYIRLTGKNGAVLGSINADEFIKDGMIDTVAWSTEAGKENYLVITWNTDAGKQVTEINFGKYVDTWTHRDAANGIKVENDKYVGVVDTASEAFLTVGEAGFKLAGVQTAINTAVAAEAEIARAAEKANADAIDVLEAEVSEHAQVTATALNDLNTRLAAAEDTLASGVGVMAVEGETPYKFASLPVEDQALVQAHDDFVWTEATTDAEGKVTLDSQVVIMKSTEPAKGLATDAYVNERIAAEKVSVTSSSKTLDVTHDGNNYNVELAWQMF